MFNTMTFDHFSELAHSSKRIAVFKEIPGDKLTPVTAFVTLRNSERDITLLESLVHKDQIGRYSHLCFNPLLSFTGHEDHITLEGEINDSFNGHPIEKLRELQHQYNAAIAHPLSGFIGGLVGFMGYDAIRLSETIPNNNPDLFEFPDLFFRFCQDNLTFDHQSGKVVLSTIVDITKATLEQCYENGIKHVERLEKTLMHTQPDTSNEYTRIETHITPDTSDEEYRAMVEKAKQYITAGDIFQVVPSRSFSSTINIDPFDLYRALRFKNPTPYMFYLNYKDSILTGASPEKLVSLENGILESCPLAGTRPRAEGEADTLMEHELQNDPKENAEHMMLVDLARNDLGIIAKPGTVKVNKLKEIERTSTVMHISSTVNAEIAEPFDAFDALLKSLPAGTLSGAPKIRAMEIIDELEKSRRGIYGGAIAGIDANGNLASCIAIRTAVIKDNQLTVRAGGGVVYDSDPQSEADETRNKANTILSAIDIAKGELQ